MAKVILFDGGDGGGIVIGSGSTGASPIPPWDTTLLRQLRALNELTHARAAMPEKLGKKLLDVVIGRLTASVLTQAEQIVGSIDEEDGLVFQDADGGFTCGSTGKPPVPFPWPVDPTRVLRELLDREVVTPEVLSFLELAARKRLDVFTVVKKPEAAAEKIGVDLTPEVAEGLASMGLDKAKVTDQIDREILDFYSRVVADGRHIKDWAVSPGQVAKQLELKISRKAIDRITDIRGRGVFAPADPGSVMSPYAVAVVIAVVIVVSRREFELPVRDLSGIQKL